MEDDRLTELAARGRAAAEDGRHEDAVRAYSEAVDAGAEWLWTDLGDARAHLGDHASARDAYEAGAGWGDETAVIRLDALEDGRLSDVIGTGIPPLPPMPRRREARDQRDPDIPRERGRRHDGPRWFLTPAGILLLLAAAAVGVVLELAITRQPMARTGLALAVLAVLALAAGWSYVAWGFGPPRRKGARHRRQSG